MFHWFAQQLLDALSHQTKGHEEELSRTESLDDGGCRA